MPWLLSFNNLVLSFIPPWIWKDIERKNGESDYCKDPGGSGIPCRTSGPQAIATTEQDDFLDQFSDEPPCSRSLWMAIDHRISIIVHPVDIHSHHFGHIDVIHDKGAVRLYSFEVFSG